MNVTANYNFTYWDGYRWKRNKNSLRPPRSTPWTTYPCDNCVILPGLRYRECNPIPYVPCPSLVGKDAITDPDPKCYSSCKNSKNCAYRCCGPTEPIQNCPSLESCTKKNDFICRLDDPVNGNCSIKGDCCYNKCQKYKLNVDNCGENVRVINENNFICRLDDPVNGNCSKKGDCCYNKCQKYKLNVDNSGENIEVVNKNIDNILKKSPVILFMKGSPDSPRCGFSRQIVDILNKNEVIYETFDILENQEIRAQLKVYSDWPTYPQLYSNAKLVGGLDIVKEMVESSNGDTSKFKASLGLPNYIENMKITINDKGERNVFIENN